MYYPKFRFMMVLFILGAALGCRPGHLYVSLSFDETQWQTKFDDRVGMIADLHKNHLRMGMSKADIEKMLGSPDRIMLPRDYSPEFAKTKGFSESWSYNLPIEIERCYSCFDTHTFNVHLDEKGNYMGYHLFCN